MTRLAADGKSLLFSTYLGGSGGMLGAPETGRGIALDSAGNVYVTEETSSINFPIRSAAQSTNFGGKTYLFPSSARRERSFTAPTSAA